MSTINDGGAAFPVPEPGLETGMTLRDYFAAKALQSQMITHPETPTENLALWSYQMADAMLRARQGA